MDNKLLVSPSPHIKSNSSVRGIMLDVIIALLPNVIASGLIFGHWAIITILTCVVSCVFFEFISRKVLRRPQTIGDLSAIVTGLILGFSLPATINPLYAVVGSAVAIVAVKQMFGGIGQNFANPAVTARIVLTVSFPAAMNAWVTPFYYKEGIGEIVTTATPLASEIGTAYDSVDLFLGIHGGSLGETSCIALLLGGVYLILRKVLSPITPIIFISTVFIGSWILGENPVTAIFSGGLFLGAFFMATDYTTSPLTAWGKVIFAFGCGVFTVLIRVFGALPEGVSFAILLMNILTPLIDRFTVRKAFGEEREKNAKT